mgnify:FL=1|tara:strand:- start:1979 stop:2494 length:516 start_codon:yes stop_codon:yes gene_type:complete
MKKLIQQYIQQSEVDNLVRQHLDAYDNGDEYYVKLFCASERHLVEYKVREWVKDIVDSQKIYTNDKYQVAVTDDPSSDVIHLSIKRHDRGVMKDWRDFQEIKNQLVGEENEGVELYPAESRLVDSANQYHIWVVRDPSFKFNFGYKERYVTDKPFGNAKQRTIKTKNIKTK